MAILSGGGSWINLQKQPVGTVTRGLLSSFEPDVPSNDPRFGPQSILKLEMDGEIKTIGCPSALARVFKNNKVEAGTPLVITYEGKRRSKKGTDFHSFKVETGPADAGFAYGANMPAANEPDPQLAERLAAARARRAA